MLTLKELKELLELNEKLMWEELAKGGSEMRRLLDLNLHRSVVKDMIIECLEAQLVERRNLETRPFQGETGTEIEKKGAA